jgi:predicted ArsR family transcriptional regulator
MSAHDMHEHSLFTWFEERRKLGARAMAILNWLKAHGPATDRTVAAALGYSDMNAVRPRITDLKQAAMVEECGETRDSVTGKTVRVVRAIGLLKQE